MTFIPEKEGDFKALFSEYEDKIRSFPGCLNLKLLKETAETATFFTYSEWESELNIELYRSSELFKSVWKITKPMFARPAEAWTVSHSF